MPPLSLTASDGTGLRLVALTANGVLEPPLAFTELHLTFENPRARTIEGRFRIALPPGAALSRFAMRIGDAWQEGEVVERQRARVAYEDFLHRRQDPALLEQESGNEFSARVFPIPAGGRKEIIVSYSHALPSHDEPYVIPLRGLPAIEALDVRVLLGDRPAAAAPASNLGGEVHERRVLELHRRDWTPDRDFSVAQDELVARAGLRNGDLVVARVAPAIDAEPQEIAGLYVLVDSSASRALGYEAQVRRVGELAAALRAGAGAATPLGVAAFDQEVAPLFEGTAGDFDAGALARLASRRPLGASDLHGALAWLAERLAAAPGRYPRVLLVTDGVATAGEVETAALRAAVQALGARGVERLDVLAVGGLRDDATLRELTTGNLAHDGQRIDGDAPRAEIARRLTLACHSGIAVAIAGAAWVWPERIDGAQPGDETLVYAELPAERPLRLALDGRQVTLGGALASAERPLLARAVAQARIDRLLHLRETTLAGDADLRQALTLQVVQLSVEQRVLTPLTALLVLETADDYARFGLERHALADILTVGAGGLEVAARTANALPPGADLAPPKAQTTGAARLREGGRRADASAARVPTARDAAAASPAPGDGEDEITVAAEAPLLDGPRPASEPAVRAEDDDGVVSGVDGGVAGGVAGGVPGGVVGGVPGGVTSDAGAENRALASPGEVPRPNPVPSEVEPAPPLHVQQERVATNPQVPPPSPPPPGRAGDVAAVPSAAEADEAGAAPYSGRFAEVMSELAARRVPRARQLAEAWVSKAPGDVLALLALGEACEASGDTTAAARAYGSLIDLFPSRADLRRLAGERLERLGPAGLPLAIDTYRKAVEQRPDHPAGHRLLAWALERQGDLEGAFAALERGLEQHYPAGRFAGVDRVLREDLGLLGAAWLHREPEQRAAVLDRLAAHGAHLDVAPSLRFVLTWETDANDVDLHVFDRAGNHAYYSAPRLASGGQLYADVTTGYGPECFTVEGSARGVAAPYRLAAHYYSRGPMGYGMGTLQVVSHDGKGGLRIEPRPFVVMTDQATVELGTVGGGKDREATGR